MIGLQDPPTSGITSGPCCAMAMATDVNDWQRCSWALRRKSRATAQSGRQELFCRVAEAVAPGGRSWCAWWLEALLCAVGPAAVPCGWSRCAGRLDTLRHAAGAHALGGRSRCCGRQEPTPSGRRCWSRRQEPPRHGRSWAAGAALEARDGRTGAAVLGGRRHCNGRQEPFLGRQLVLRRAAGAAAEPLWRVSGDASPCGRSRAGWMCSRRRSSG